MKEYGGFRLGTTSYLPKDNTMTYRDMRTGELKQTTLYDAIANRSSEVSLMNTYKWDNGLTWKWQDAMTTRTERMVMTSTPMIAHQP